jgi:uncharacterized membrane protein
MTLRTWYVLLTLAGLLISVYLTLVRYSEGGIPLACANTGFLSCEEVTNSAESMLGPVSVALLGVIFFGLTLVLEALRKPRVQLAWTALGLLFVFYLVYAEMFLIGALCLWCTVVHAIVAALFLIAVAEATAEPSVRRPTPVNNNHLPVDVVRFR